MGSKIITKILVANRGEIARRVMRTARSMGIGTVAVYSEADKNEPFVRDADQAVCIGAPPALESYLAMDKIIEAAKKTEAMAIHPGYGFLAENAAFAEKCEQAGITFIGPTSKAISVMGSKIESKLLMKDSGVPVIPGYNIKEGDDIALLKSEAEKIGYPVLVKASAGGGGKGMRVVRDPKDFESSYESSIREAQAAFGDSTMLLEKYFVQPRHIEFQIFGDHQGNAVHVFERECSIQRRHQKIIEETPSLAVDKKLRKKMGEAAVAAAKSVSYTSAGTVEFILDNKGEFYFLEMNTRLQVEHPITECITGLDLVRWQIMVAQGESLPLNQAEIDALTDTVGGAAVECRLYAEDPYNDFLPANGTILSWKPIYDEDARYDSGVQTGSKISTYYDPLLAKIITHGPNRFEATAKMIKALSDLVVLGVTTNRDYLLKILSHPSYLAGAIDTEFIDRYQQDLAEQAPSEELRTVYAVAAGLYQQSIRKKESEYLPSMSTGFRNILWRKQEAVYDMPGGEKTIYYRDAGKSTFEITADEQDYSAEILEIGEDFIRIEFDGAQHNFSVAMTGDADNETLYLHGIALTMVMKVVPRFPDVEAEQELSGGYKSPMPGTIIKVSVEVGANVNEFDPLVIMESMKMEQTIYAEETGVVKEIFVSEGDVIDAGATLIVIEGEGEEK
jgi:acetyl-CoA carboxylase biotin carboxylase subunit